MKGAIAVVDDTGCSVVDKQNAAVAKGAVGLLVVSAPGDQRQPGRVCSHRATTSNSRSRSVSSTRRRRGAAPHQRAGALVLDSKPVMKKITKRGGADQDRRHQERRPGRRPPRQRPPRAPASTTTARGWRRCWKPRRRSVRSPHDHQRRAVRLLGIRGERHSGAPPKYVRGLAREQLDDIALYLNFDMLGSPNAGYFTYDGDQSGSAQPRHPVARRCPPDRRDRTHAGGLPQPGGGPAGRHAAGDEHRLPPFLAAGVPIGGLTTGSSQRKTEVQARLWGGQAGVAFDPNYHTPATPSTTSTARRCP